MDSELEHSVRRTELPIDFAEHAAAATDLDTTPTTLEEWWSIVLDQYAADDLTIGLDDLYSEAPTRHEVHVNGYVRYTHCALDALEAAVIVEQDEVTVRSVDPVLGTPVTFRVDDDGVSVSPEGALICFGANLDPEAIEAAGSLATWSVQDDKAEVKSGVCQYTNAFESTETYEQWAAETGSVTAPLPPANLVSLLRKLPYDSDDSAKNQRSK